MLVGIPAFNEASAIGKVIKKIPHRINGITKIQVLVVNDGSIDDTDKVAKRSGAFVLNHLINRGLGGALKTIFEYARLMKYDILVTCDADGQHEGKDVIRLVKPLLQNKKDVVIGVRWQNKKKLPFRRLLVNQIANLLTFMLCGIYTSDSQSGMRSFSKKAIKSINIQTDGMEVSSEIFREIKNKKLSLSEVPIKAIYTQYSQSKGQKITDAPDVLFRLILRLIR